MPAPIKLSIDLKKLRKAWMKAHQNGALYCDIIVYENDEPDNYGNTFSCKQGMPKEVRDAGEKAGYCGNGKRLENRSGPARPPERKPAMSPERERQQQQAADLGTEDDIPF